MFADADSSQQSIHYLEGVLRGIMRDLADVPTFNQTTRTTAANILRRYQVDFAEFYGAVPQFRSYTTRNLLCPEWRAANRPVAGL
jgi:hypothetical protein